MNSFTRSVDLLHRAMDVSTLRYSVSANNLANAGVPNFKRTTVNFEAALKEAIDSEKNAKDSFVLKTSDDRHIQSKTYTDYRTVEPRRVLDYATTSDANGNNVDAEAEAMDILKTQLNYQLLTQMQSFQFSQMHIVLK
ncbi:MAG TPA: flagellar basal body rod protein FlgB [Treponemataceae bacterium]|jgi:flagellar basal-body rod protein FlgB|nr:flagellar basal body rod protein FlgB [Spirochaetota bacterium]NMA56128.1 flagellar basal body rod protein FlgB [Treponema sp.]HOF11302.1 flagellar basal body rod protein FlgB [Treponemataceae bacterium]HOQ92198.1 flagellar basal body rod protein FlgB [Treponemataceae bacterium]HPY52597.1 flagellar basal body rod protein FlgB [Treponemataceae bacterium]